MINKPDKKIGRVKRHRRIRNKISGTPTCPRLCVFRSSKNIYAQVIDDVNCVTIASASTKVESLKGVNGGNVAAATEVGKLVAKEAIAKGVTQVVFDRGGYLYHGRVAALAEGAREGGLQF